MQHAAPWRRSTPRSAPTLARYFRDEVLPALTPLAIDTSRPFPMLASLSLNLAVLLGAGEGEDAAAPGGRAGARPAAAAACGRPASSGTVYVLLEDVIRAELPSCSPARRSWRRRRSASRATPSSTSTTRAAATSCRRSRRSCATAAGARSVRLEIEARRQRRRCCELLAERLELAEADVYRIAGPLDIRAAAAARGAARARGPARPAAASRCRALEAAEPRTSSRCSTSATCCCTTPTSRSTRWWRFVARGGRRPRRAGDQADALPHQRRLADRARARARGRERQAGDGAGRAEARFDEQSNIRWARSLEEAGAHVIYGVRGSRRTPRSAWWCAAAAQGIRRYVHLGTGNYNEQTARLYTDFGADDRATASIGEDASAFFNALTGYSRPAAHEASWRWRRRSCASASWR